MVGMWRTFGASAALCIGLGIAPQGWSQTLLSPDQMRAAATASLRAGDDVQAEAFADALLQRDPTDHLALLVRARALRNQGRYTEAQRAARKAWAGAGNDAERYSSALFMAQALSSDGKRTRAQLWLRRAGQHAPNDAARARAKQHFNYVKQRNPWQTSLSFTLAPNSNINNGSASDRSYLNYKISELLFGRPVEYELSGSALALSGLEVGASMRSRYRFAETAKTAHDFNFGLSYRTYMLSNSAKDIAPAASGDDFAFGTVSLGYGFKQINMESKGEFSGDLDIGQSWYGGSRYASYLRASAGQSLRVSRERLLRFDLDLERQIGQATADVDKAVVAASLSQALASGNVAFFNLKGTTTQSRNVDADYDEIELRGGLALARPVMGADLQFGLGIALRDFDSSRHSPDGREDMRVFADVTAVFREIEYYGFNPAVTFTASSNDSSIGLFDTNRVGLSLGIRSSF